MNAPLSTDRPPMALARQPAVQDRAVHEALVGHALRVLAKIPQALRWNAARDALYLRQACADRAAQAGTALAPAMQR